MIVISDWLEQCDIEPLRWGMTEDDLIKVSCISQKQIADLKKRKYPYIPIDHVDLHFIDDLNYRGLVEIVVTIFTPDSDTESQCFELGWLGELRCFGEISDRLTQLNVEWVPMRNPYSKALDIRVKGLGILGFDPDGENDQSAELFKIFFVE